ncbi:MAG TPA: universal stress protein [Candidatus Angelobacter sp.]|nr:universal stress protein [Candidatus Angelobacter sp.]
MELVEAASSVSFKNILLATDLSAASEKALLYARAFSRDQHSHVHTIHVSAPGDYQLLCPEAFAETFNPLEPGGNVGSGLLRGLLRGLPHEVPLRGNKVWEIIEDVALRNEIDLLIVGTHGRTGVQKMLFGSVAEEVFRDTSCPVLTVGEHVKKPASGFRGQKVLLATDCRPTSLAPHFAAAICEDLGGELTVLVVGDANPANQPWIRQRIKDQLGSAAPQLNSLFPRPVFLVENGDPPDQILRVAATLDADLIVLGAHHPRDVRNAAHFPWSTASQVIAAARCPVLTVRDRRVAGSVEERSLSEVALTMGR